MLPITPSGKERAWMRDDPVTFFQALREQARKVMGLDSNQPLTTGCAPPLLTSHDGFFVLYWCTPKPIFQGRIHLAAMLGREESNSPKITTKLRQCKLHNDALLPSTHPAKFLLAWQYKIGLMSSPYCLKH